MFKSQLYYFVLLFGINGVFLENDTCFELISNQQSTTDRFTTEQLQWICNSFIKWHKKSNSPRLMKGSKIGPTSKVLETDSGKQEQDSW